MNLIKELLKEKAPQLTEAEADMLDVHKFHKNIRRFEEAIELLSSNLKEGSQFRALVSRLGGDESYINDANNALAKLEEAISDLNMYTSTAIDSSEDDDK